MEIRKQLNSVQKKNMRSKVQAFGGFLTGMVIPNMGAFIAWGFITALFIPTGWVPNEYFGKLVGPMITYMLPLLLAYTGGKLVAGERGGVAGVIGTFGLIIGSDIPMFLGAMVMGPFSAYAVKKFDSLIENKIPVGFEMVINNFSLGILGLLLSLFSYSLIGPVILQANKAVTVLIEGLIKTGFLPILSLINEPAKVLFLNNVIDQGIYYPLGMQAALKAGKSIYFMVASNPGAGLGLLLAYSLFGKGASKKTAPGAIIIHFLGGIHEIYFPYVLMKPILIISMILGSASGILTFSIFNAGLVAGPSPGSIFAYLALTPKGNFIGVIAGVLVAAAVSFAITSFILKSSKEEEDFEQTVKKSKEMKQEGKDLLNSVLQHNNAPIKLVVFACDAGLGSSAMGANAFKKRVEKEGLSVAVKNYAIEKVPQEADVIVTHKSLLDRTRLTWPDKRIVTIENFIKDSNIDELLAELIARK
ncbi:PTS mannitol transporter subunit IICB [Clostridium sp. SYSU_GA19001]|uniref:PTS mannitol transporter subunit IICB n=1 Tax=Clostridium caldaquaticum TaxID=2940653 RepID=UPI002076E105|nr:PTS mannitol transporter subunit IICB [Clostridium caldaquaticum]MCM8710151.1 PTS mannitol transporter subunit IICB [Clostridium caldaquaticum]